MAQALKLSQVIEQKSSHMWFTHSSLGVYSCKNHLVLRFINKSSLFFVCNGFNEPIN